MTTITFPSGVVPNGVSLRLATVQRTHSSPFGGSEQVVDLLNDRWKMSISLPNRQRSEAAAVEAFINAMRGQTNTVNLYYFGRKVPLGTMRGSPITNPASQGADQIVLGTGVAGVTLLAGDMIGINGLLLQVREDCVADGVGAMTVKFVNRLRKAIAGSLAVTWDRPTAPFRLVSSPGVQHAPGYAEGVALDFDEVIT